MLLISILAAVVVNARPMSPAVHISQPIVRPVAQPIVRSAPPKPGAQSKIRRRRVVATPAPPCVMRIDETWLGIPTRPPCVTEPQQSPLPR